MTSKAERRARKDHRNRIAFAERLQAQQDRETYSAETPADEDLIAQMALKLTGKAPMPLKKWQRPIPPEQREYELNSVLEYLREDEANGQPR